MADFHVIDHGSLIALRPLNEEAKAWVAENLPDDAQWFGGSVAIEPRYFPAIYDGIRKDGFFVKTYN